MLISSFNQWLVKLTMSFLLNKGNDEFHLPVPDDLNYRIEEFVASSWGCAGKRVLASLSMHSLTENVKFKVQVH